MKERIATVPNAITCARGAIFSLVFMLATIQDGRELLLLCLVANWAGDLLDGFAARHWKRETILGAQLDYNVDRLLATGAIVAASMIDRGSSLIIIAASTVWLQYAVFDQILCAQFLRFTDLWTPDEFWRRDNVTWAFNWSPIAKAAGHIPLLLLTIGGYGAVPSIVTAVLLVLVRTGVYIFRNASAIDVDPASESSPYTESSEADESSRYALTTSTATRVAS